MTTNAHHQLPLALGGEANHVPSPPIRIRTTSKRAATGAKLYLPIADSGFSPVSGVPSVRSQCPTERPCPHVRCRYHLAMEDAEHRAGRPGLALVPRGPKGLTLQVRGHAGDERAGTTLRPVWLKYKGLELERECKVWIWTGEDGTIEMNETQDGALDYWLARVSVDEPVLVFNHDTSEIVAKARLTKDGRLGMDRALPASAFLAVLTRARTVTTCALDLVKPGHVRSSEEVGEAIGRSPSMVRKIVKKALRKLRAQGVDLRDLMERE